MGIQLFTAVISILLLLFLDFGGFYYYDYYYKIHNYGYISFGSGIISSFIVLIGVAGFLMVIRSSYFLLKEKKISEKNIKDNALKSIQGAVIPLILSVVAALILWVTNLENSWWLDTGFYAAFFGGALIIIFSKLTLKILE